MDKIFWHLAKTSYSRFPLFVALKEDVGSTTITSLVQTNTHPWCAEDQDSDEE